jgi:hypothetical protein
MKQQDEEIEVRFLDTDKQTLVAQLRARTGVEDLGESICSQRQFSMGEILNGKQQKDLCEFGIMGAAQYT